MKSKIIDGVRVLVFTLTESYGEAFTTKRDAYDSEPDKSTLSLVKVRNRAVITTDSPEEIAELFKDGDASDNYLGGSWSDMANLHAGPKTLARLFQTALDTPQFVVTSTKTHGISSGYGAGALKLKRVGSKLFFIAPCGAKGWLTVNEATKLVAELQSL